MENEKPIIKDDEIDLVQLVKTIWAGRKIIIYSIIACTLIGLVIAFTSPVKYSATATLLPSSDKKTSNLGGLGALAGMAGINIGSMMGDASGIPADLYPQIVNSYPFQKELIYKKFTFEKFPEQKTLFETANIKTSPSIFSTILKYTIKLPWTIKEAIFAKNSPITSPIASEDATKIIYLSKEEKKALELTNNSTTVTVDKKSELVNVEVEMSEALLSAQMADAVIEQLQQYIINYKTSQVRENLNFVQSRYDEKKAEYEKARLQFFDYKDSHRNQVAERADIEFQQLSDNYEITSAVIKGLAQQLEQAKITVKEETPVFTVIEPVQVPLEKSAPKKSLILAVSIFLGGFLGIGIVIAQIVIHSFRTKNNLL